MVTKDCSFYVIYSTPMSLAILFCLYLISYYTKSEYFDIANIILSFLYYQYYLIHLAPIVGNYSAS